MRVEGAGAQAHARPQFDQYMADLMQVHRLQTAELHAELVAKEGMELQFRLRERMLQVCVCAHAGFAGMQMPSHTPLRYRLRRWRVYGAAHSNRGAATGAQLVSCPSGEEGQVWVTVRLG
jgi:hypothetical protein